MGAIPINVVLLWSCVIVPSSNVDLGSVLAPKNYVTFELRSTDLKQISILPEFVLSGSEVLSSVTDELSACDHRLPFSCVQLFSVFAHVFSLLLLRFFMSVVAASSTQRQRRSRNWIVAEHYRFDTFHRIQQQFPSRSFQQRGMLATRRRATVTAEGLSPMDRLTSRILGSRLKKLNWNASVLFLRSTVGSVRIRPDTSYMESTPPKAVLASDSKVLVKSPEDCLRLQRADDTNSNQGAQEKENKKESYHASSKRDHVPRWF